MCMWIPYKARPHELKNRRKTPYTKERLRYCRICGKEVHGSGTLCPSCRSFIKQKQHEERRAKK